MEARTAKTGGPRPVWSHSAYPVGEVYVSLGARGVTDLLVSSGADDAAFGARLALKYGGVCVEDGTALKDVLGWLDGYFRGEAAPFPLPLDPMGTGFEKAVWKVIAAIPRGSVRTYGQLAVWAGRPGAARAVGGACGANPVPIIIPCHRVVSANGPGGYTGGLAVKRALLGIEGVEL
ncbi:MAG: methylated-DNA--[protein]-cysteine S-methyltransferase [Thermodesulfobacteriota bacterium]